MVRYQPLQSTEWKLSSGGKSYRMYDLGLPRHGRVVKPTLIT